MSGSILNHKTAEYVANLFRPILEAIDICNFDVNVSNSKCIRLSDVLYSRYELERCVVLVKYSSEFPNDHYGLCVTSYIEEEDIFFFQIALNTNLCTKLSYTKRKSVFVHEVLHLIATLLSLTEIRLKTLKQRLIKKLKIKLR